LGQAKSAFESQNVIAACDFMHVPLPVGGFDDNNNNINDNAKKQQQQPRQRKQQQQ